MAALKQILITRKIAALEDEKKTLAEKITKTAARREAWKVREAKAVAALDEMDENTTEEERTAFQTEADEIDREDGEITAEEQANATRSGEIDNEITSLKSELADIENRSSAAGKTPTPKNSTKREVNINMSRYTPEYRERCADLATRAEVKDFCKDLRNIALRGVTNVKLTVPTVALPTLRQRIDTYSKLKAYVKVDRIMGEGKQNIIASTPEAVWTETTGKFNELNFNIAQVRMDGSKVAGYIPVPNPYLQDSDEDLAALVLDMLGQAIGIALDKAILYGTGDNMPVGIITRLLATTKPTWWETSAPDFTNLSAKNVGKATSGATGVGLLQEAFKILGVAQPVYNTGDESLFWAMNPTTWTNIKIATMSLNSAGSVVAGVSNEMPVIGGEVVPLNFIPVGIIVGGYGKHYQLGERRDVELRRSEHVLFLEDQTVFAGVARYDGKTTAGKAFAAFSIDPNKSVTSDAVEFAPDTANAGA